jgi:molybdopterin-guanine dinucleotide biosynthesis protein A
MGRDKASLVLAGRTMAERAMDRMKLVAGRVSVCGRDSGLASSVSILPDPMEGAGPLAPLVVALEDAALQGNDALAVVLAVDLPLVPWELLHWLVQRARVSGAWATIPRVDDRPQPLCAVYRATLAPSLRGQLMSGERKLMRAVELACADANRFDLFDPAAVMPEPRREALPVWFLNVNTPEDLLQAERGLAERRVW